MKCPGFEKLVDFLDARLTEEEAHQIDLHLTQGCAVCSKDRAWYQTLKSIVSADDRFRPAPWVRRRALDIFENERFRSDRLIDTARAAARLVYDSMQRLSTAGARPLGASGRQLVYQAAGYNIDIQIAASAKEGVDIMGQILREEEAGFGSVTGLLIDLIQDHREVWSTTTSSFGEFTMHEIDSGDYDLRVETGEAVITIERLPVVK
ncbi:MAG TPA: hypothetical protein VFV34_02480 [Blastocatellia bacterium]|nr:hypothetical protein [Blastocatellia bacterium]